MSILELKDVCYSYSAEKPVLRGMNCTFECGTLYALVGKSRRGQEHAAEPDGGAGPAGQRPGAV